jgi:hypothetical protein
MHPDRPLPASLPSLRSQPHVAARRRVAARLAAALAVVGAGAAVVTSDAAAQRYDGYDVGVDDEFDYDVEDGSDDYDDYDVGEDYGTYFDALECPDPDAAHCLNAIYQESECGRTAIANGQCQVHVQDALTAAPTFGERYDVDGDGLYTYASELAAADRSGDFDYSLIGTYHGDLGRYAVEVRNPLFVSWPWGGTSSPTGQRAQWEANGNRVASCEEMVYEGWYTYSRFEDEVARRGGDARAIFDAARATGFGATKILTRDGDSAKVGRSTAEIPALPYPTKKIPKNAYYLFEPTPFDAGMIPPELIPSEDGRAFYDGDWAWHVEMDDYFRGWFSGSTILDGMLDTEYERQKKFVKLLERRARILEALYAEATVAPISLSAFSAEPVYEIGVEPASSFGSMAVADDIAGLSSSAVDAVITSSAGFDPALGYTGGYTGNMGRLWVVNQQIIEELRHASGFGCLGTSWKYVCDWSPRMFADMVGGAYVSKREEEYQRCLALTANDFSDASPIGAPADYDLPVWDYRASAANVRAFLNNYEDSLTVDDEHVTATGLWWGRADWRQLGNDQFNAGYAYDFGLGLERSEEAGGCVADLVARANAEAWATVAGHRIGLVDSQTEARTIATNKVHVKSHTKLLETYEVYDKVDDPFPTTKEFEPWHISQEWGASATFWIGPVPVTGSIGIHGEAGIKVEQGITMSRNCTTTPKIDIKGNFTATPYVQADAFISALVGARGLGAGLRTDLQLAKISAPLTVGATIYADGRDVEELKKNTVIGMEVALGLTIDSLGGTVSGVVETPFKTWRRTIFAWEGKRLVNETWRQKWRLPMTSIRGLLGV